MSEIINAIVPIEKIKAHPQNYNQHPEEQLQQLAKSLESLGQFRSVVIWQQPDGTYIQLAGHGVVEAMKREGATEVRADILPPSLDAMTAKQVMLADNLHAQNSLPDDTALARLLEEQQNAGFDLAALGTDEEALRQMLESLGDEVLTGDGEEEDEEGDELPEDVETRARVGDIWQLGRHKIACLDSTDPEQVRRLIGQSAVQFVFSDPPYGISIVATNVSVGGGEAYDIPFGGVKNRTTGDVGGGASHIRKTGKSYLEEWQEKQNGHASTNGAKSFVSGGIRPTGTVGRWGANVADVGKYFPVIGDESTTTAIAAYRLCIELFPKAIQVWWGANYYANALPPSSCWIVWDKENTGNFADVELAWCSHKGAARLFRHMWNGMLKASEQGQRRVHPTQKPVKLAEFTFSEFGQEGDIIFDPFLGSGISVIAAERLSRTVIGCELSPEYIDIIAARWEKETGQTATLVERNEEVAHA